MNDNKNEIAKKIKDETNFHEQSKYDKAKKSFKKVLIAELIIIPISFLTILFFGIYSGKNYFIDYWYIISLILIAMIMAPYRAWYYCKDEFKEAEEEAFNDVWESLKKTKE